MSYESNSSPGHTHAVAAMDKVGARAAIALEALQEAAGAVLPYGTEKEAQKHPACGKRKNAFVESRTNSVSCSELLIYTIESGVHDVAVAYHDTLLSYLFRVAPPISIAYLASCNRTNSWQSKVAVKHWMPTSILSIHPVVALGRWPPSRRAAFACKSLLRHGWGNMTCEGRLWKPNFARMDPR